MHKIEGSQIFNFSNLYGRFGVHLCFFWLYRGPLSPIDFAGDHYDGGGGFAIRLRAFESQASTGLLLCVGAIKRGDHRERFACSSSIAK
jgi:hypothetical protein